MPVTIVVGGQYGSEAKAKAAVHIASTQCGCNVVGTAGIRCGGPNAGHTVFLGPEKKKYVLRHVPSLVAVPYARLVICAGSMVDVDLLLKEVREIEELGVPVRDRLFVSQDAVAVDTSAIEREKSEGMGALVGSTQTGTGATAAARAMRTAEPLSKFKDLFYNECINLTDTFDLTHSFIHKHYHVVVEGTQGFALSMLHSGHYPFCTSKDTTASAFAAEAGIPPSQVDNVIMVIRTYPIRVGGNSGPLPNEITWDEIKRRCGAPDDVQFGEMTSVTKKVRRVGEFDMEQVKRAVLANSPSMLAIHGADYLNWKDRGVRMRLNSAECPTCLNNRISELSEETRSFFAKVHQETKTRIGMIFTGPHQDDLVDATGH